MWHVLGRVVGIVLLAVAVQALSMGTASADRIDRLTDQLRNGDSYKVRLAAAINLSKSRDPRAIPAFIAALGDKDKNIRGVAATSLGKLVGAGTERKLKQRAVKALESAKRRDKAQLVRKQADKALAAIRAADGTGGNAAGGIYVNVGSMASKVSGARDMKNLMRKTAEKTFAKKASSMTTTWPGGKAPTAKQLRGTQAFHVDGTLVSLKTQAKGSSTLVSCKVSMLIATYPKKSMFGFLDGGAKVQVGTSDREIQYAKEDCIAAVVEDLIAKKIIPAIRTKAQAGSRATQTQSRPGRKRQRRR